MMLFFNILNWANHLSQQGVLGVWLKVQNVPGEFSSISQLLGA